MTRKLRSITIMLSIVTLSMLALLVFLVARAWIDAGPILDMRL